MTKRRKSWMIRMTIIQTTMKDGSTGYYWIEVPAGMTTEEAASTQRWHGPFKTAAASLCSVRDAITVEYKADEAEARQ